MATNSSLGSRIVARELTIQRLLSEASLVGGIYTMGYDECLVLTNDLWKKHAGGVPQHCFLLATAMMPGEAPDVEDEEVILLRVIGPAALPAEAELVHVREQAMREMVVTRGPESAASSPAILDVLTRNEIQFSGIKAKILGTFYDDVNGSPMLSFGSDVETFYSASRYKVYKPYAESLAIIASYPEITAQEESARQGGGATPQRVRIGTIRYSSSNRRRRLHVASEQNIAVPVKVNIQDFVALKTAVFGMTRLGKSNTMKTIATAICQHAAETGQQIGQLLFDPAGEYANVNVQDRTALAQVGTEFVTIFRYGADGTQEGIRPLTSNFFADQTIDVTWLIISAYLTPRNQANYIRSFLSADVIGPENQEDDRSAYSRARRRRAALYATLMKAGFSVPRDFSITIVANRDVINAINQHRGNRRASDFQTGRGGSLRLNTGDLRAFWDSLIDAQDAGSDLGDWVDAELEAILALYKGSVGSGYRLLEPLRAYHSLARMDDYADEILNELISGKILGRLMTVLEHLTMVAYLHFLLQRQPRVLGDVGFILDGLLALFGPQAWLHTAILSFLHALQDALSSQNMRHPIIIGVEKGGQFSEHASAISEHIPRRCIMLLPDDYIYRHILTFRASPNSYFGRDTYYGQKFFYKTAKGQLLTMTIPKSASTVSDPHNPAHYRILPDTLALLDRVGTTLYEDSLIPVALAHSFASIPLRTGSKVLTLLSRKLLGLSSRR